MKYAAVYGGSEEIMADLAMKQALKADTCYRVRVLGGGSGNARFTQKHLNLKVFSRKKHNVIEILLIH